MINLFNEKIFLFVWFWLVFISICTILNFLYWLISSLYGVENERLICRYLRTNGDITDAPHSRKSVSKFIRSHLRSDGVLILKFVSANVGDMVATELVKQLWNHYDAKYIENSKFHGGIGSDQTSKSSKMSTFDYPDDKESHGEMIEGLYPVDHQTGSPLLPSAPQNGATRRNGGYPGPPPLAPKPPKTPLMPV